MQKLYTKNQVKTIDALAMKSLAISSYELMVKAGNTLFKYLQHKKNLLIVTGPGNNAGDGFIIALRALEKGANVLIWSLEQVKNLPKDAKKAAQNYIDNGGEIIFEAPLKSCDCIVDAIFGTGLNRAIEGKYANAIKWINTQNNWVLSVDIPSGLDADTGSLYNCAVKARITASIICNKPGLFTNNAKDYCGELFLEKLDVKQNALLEVHSSTYLLDDSVLKVINSRNQNSHKGSFGQVVVVGGFDNMLGALILSGVSALKSGCGIVEVVSNNKQAALLVFSHPELIVATKLKNSRFLNSCQVIAIGPGLGLSTDAKNTLKLCISLNKPLVIDADALTLMANYPPFKSPVVLTPHPKEAACLLGTTVKNIQKDRLKAALKISEKFNAVVILKGAGSIVADPSGNVYICPYGHSGMATAGMGDVLTGVVASLIAQGYDAKKAAITAVVWHARVADKSTKGIGLVASDVIENLHTVI